jgi:2-polyprenyl-3-methyl-5-hydroxy-6-metoxy-1,4-benzoquinol methylase
VTRPESEAFLNRQPSIGHQQFRFMPLLSKYLTHARLSRIGPYLGEEILDVGCGYGELLEYLHPTTKRIVLLDRSSERQSEVERRLARTKVTAEFVVEDIGDSEIKLNLPPFDTVVMAALLEHLTSPAIALQNIRNIMKSGAKLVLTTPTPLGGKLHWLGSHLGLVYVEAAEEHVGFHGYSALKSLFQAAGFRIDYYEKFLFGLNQLMIATLTASLHVSSDESKTRGQTPGTH